MIRFLVSIGVIPPWQVAGLAAWELEILVVAWLTPAARSLGNET